MQIIKNKNVLLVVDVQNDFCLGGALAVPDGDAVVPVINRIAKGFYRVVATQDWHPENHVSFVLRNPGAQSYEVTDWDGSSQVLWPVHCVAGTKGAAFHPLLDDSRFHLIVRKGTAPDQDSYSAFLENDRRTKTGLEGYLRSLGIQQVLISGLATDYCVLASALDAASLGFEAGVLIDACRGVDIPQGSVVKALRTLKDRGIQILSSSDL
jgi:nicotinamidase/pyrazinamidase